MTADLPRCETLLLERQGATLFLTLNRPASRNALNAAMWSEIDAVFAAIHADRTIRTVVMRGAGGTFCAGGDINERSQLRDDASATEVDPVAARNRRAGTIFTRIDEAPQAVIAVVEGFALGGGFGLACAADIVIASSDVRFGLPEVTLGLAPAQIVPFLLRRIGTAQLRRFALTAARIGADEAHRVGIIDELCTDTADLEARLATILAQLDKGAPGAIASAKQLIRNVEQVEQAEFLDHAAQAIARMTRGSEGIEGATAFREKRAPSWRQAGI